MPDIFVIGINDDKIMDRLFEEDASSDMVTLNCMIKLALSKESASMEHSSGQLLAAVNIKQEDELSFHQQKRVQQTGRPGAINRPSSLGMGNESKRRNISVSG